MFFNIKKYIINYLYRLKTRVEVDNDFYDDIIFLNDLEV